MKKKKEKMFDLDSVDISVDCFIDRMILSGLAYKIDRGK